MTAVPLPINHIVEELLALGVQPGGVLVVHTAFSKLAPIEGGPTGLIEALQRTLGPEGTLVMPSMSDDDEHPFDARTTPCREMGIVPDTFWRQAGVLRSDNPHAFAARGRHAATITQPHPLDLPHGPNSPVGYARDLAAQVLLLGVGHDGNTTVHLAEYTAGVRYRLPKTLTVLKDGRPTTIAYAEIDHCCANFARMDDWLEQAGKMRRGRIGHGEARLMNAADVVDIAVAHLSADETAFLHPPGIDEECDAARASIPTERR